MSLRVAHVVQSVVAEPGAVSVCLPGLIARSDELGVSSHGTQAPSDADVVHIHGWGYPSAIASAREGLRARRALIVSPLGGVCEPVRKRKFFEKLRFMLRERPLLRSARIVLAVNQPEGQALVQSKMSDNARILGYGIDCKTYASCVSGSERRIVFLGWVHPLGGIGELFRAIAELGPVAEGWTVDIAGRYVGDWRAKLEAALRRKGAEHRVRYIDANDEASQAALLHGASLVVAPSFHYDAGVSLLQAAAAGVPAIATKFAARTDFKDVMTVCDPTRNGLREALRRVMGLSDEERMRIGERAKATCLATCDWAVLAPKYAELYREVAGR